MSASIGRLRRDFKPYAQYLLAVATARGLRPRVTSGYRSIREQTVLYERYRRGQHPLPVAAPGTSMHNYGLALDLVSDDNAYLGRLWQELGGTWGGSRDPVHFQAPASWRGT